MEILSIAKEKSINVYAVKGSWELNETIQSKLIAMCFSMAAEIGCSSAYTLKTASF